MKNLQPAQGKVQISGTFEMRDKDGNLVKSVPFTGAIPMGKEQEDGELCERDQSGSAERDHGTI